MHVVCQLLGLTLQDAYHTPSRLGHAVPDVHSKRTTYKKCRLTLPQLGHRFSGATTNSGAASLACLSHFEYDMSHS